MLSHQWKPQNNGPFSVHDIISISRMVTSVLVLVDKPRIVRVTVDYDFNKPGFFTTAAVMWLSSYFHRENRAWAVQRYNLDSITMDTGQIKSKTIEVCEATLKRVTLQYRFDRKNLPHLFALIKRKTGGIWIRGMSTSTRRRLYRPMAPENNWKRCRIVGKICHWLAGRHV